MENFKWKKSTLMIVGSAVFLLCIIYLVIQVKSHNIGIQIPLLAPKGDAKVTFVLGDAYYRDTALKYPHWKQLILGIIVEVGYEIKTLADSKVDISFGSKTVIRLEKNSLFHLSQFSAKALELSLERGSLYGNFRNLLETQKIKIQTPIIIAKPKNARVGFLIHKQGRSKRILTTIRSLSGLSEINPITKPKERIFLSELQSVSLSRRGGSARVKKMSRLQAKALTDILNSLHKNEVLVIAHNINFKQGSYELFIDSYPELDRILKILKKRKAHIRVEGHTDSEGSVKYNRELSIKRAESIKKYLVDNGMNKDLLDVAGYGKTRPIADNKTEKGRTLNRRVEFSVIEDKESQDKNTIQGEF